MAFSRALWLLMLAPALGIASEITDIFQVISLPPATCAELWGQHRKYRSLLNNHKALIESSKLNDNLNFTRPNQMALDTITAELYRQRIFNIGYFRSIRDPTPIVQQISRYVEKAQGFSFGMPALPMLYTGYDQTHQIVRLGTPIGKSFYFKVEEGAEAFLLKPVPLGSEQQAAQYFTMKSALLSDFPKIGQLYDPNLVEKMALNQIKGSTTGKEDKSNESLRHLIAANEFSMDLIGQNKDLTADNLRILNILATSKNPEILFESRPIYNGIFRGEKIKMGENGQFIDLSKTDVGLGGVGKYVSPDKVSDYITRWLIDAKAVTKGTSPKVILSLIRRFISIHPFIGGNGRTSRVLLDHFMIKAGWDSVNHESEPIGKLLFIEEDEAFAILLRSYQLNGNSKI